MIKYVGFCLVIFSSVFKVNQLRANNTENKIIIIYKISIIAKQLSDFIIIYLFYFYV